jgi:hypothetical protein
MWADFEQVRLAAGRRLARGEPQPSRQIACALECCSRADRRDQSGRDQRADAGDRREPTHILIFPRETAEFRVEGSNAPIELRPLCASRRRAPASSRLSHDHPAPHKGRRRRSIQDGERRHWPPLQRCRAEV